MMTFEIIFRRAKIKLYLLSNGFEIFFKYDCYFDIKIDEVKHTDSRIGSRDPDEN